VHDYRAVARARTTSTKEIIMTPNNNKEDDGAQIRRLVDSWTEAVRSKDIDRLMSHYATDIVVFDLAPPLQYTGADAYRTNWEGWFPTFRGPIGYEIRDLNIVSGENVAYCHSFNRITGTRTNDETTDVWVRATFCCRKIGGKWKIQHGHQSVPFYMDGSYRAAIDLKP
jgi:uncharacterized protein (TIGR02246 family)